MKPLNIFKRSTAFPTWAMTEQLAQRAFMGQGIPFFPKRPSRFEYNIFVRRQMSLFMRKKRYALISYEKRLQLIEMVERQGSTIVQSARRLRIKLPTAKVILKNYRKKGEVLDKPSTRREKELPEALSEGLVEDADGRADEERQNEAADLPFEPCHSYIIFFTNFHAGFFPFIM